MSKDHRREEASITQRRKERPLDDEPMKETHKEKYVPEPEPEPEPKISILLVGFMIFLVLTGTLVYIVRRTDSSTSPLQHCCPCTLNETVPTEPPEPKQDSLSMLVMGKMSTGKPTLIYGLLGLGDEEIKEKQRPSLAKISINHVNAHDIKVKIFMWSLPDDTKDSPELEDNFVAQVRNVDLVLFTMRMDDVRIRPGDVAALRKLEQTFGTTIWDKTVIALTYANKVSKTDEATGEEVESKTIFDSKRVEWVHVVHDVLKATVPRDLICSIPILPAGLYNEPTLYEESWRDMLISGVMSRVTDDAQKVVKKAFDLETQVKVPASFC